MRSRRSLRNMAKPTCVIKGFKIFIYLISCAFVLTGCGSTYPKATICQAVIRMCAREYKVKVDAKIAGNTIAVYLPAENLFDAVFNVDSKASKKLNDVILSVSRVTLSTDAKLKFYIVIAQDPKMPEVEIIYIRYIEDVKRFFMGDISRDEFSKRAIILLQTPPQAQKEKILKEFFAKLDIKDAQEVIKDYLNAAQNVSGISDISYWNGRFFIKQITLSEFLASQIEQRLKIEFKQDKNLNRWYELKSAEGKYFKRNKKGIFILNVNISNRATPLYLDSGLELEAQKKKKVVYGQIIGVASHCLWAYKFEDFGVVEILVLGQRQTVAKEKLWNFKKNKVKIKDLM